MTYSFHKPAFEDIKWIKRKFEECQPQCCEFSVGNVLGWSKFYDGKIGNVEDCLTLRLYNDDSFCYPKGENSENAVRAIVGDFDYPKFSFLEKHETEIIERLFPGKYEFIPDRNSFDYVYSRESLATLKGNKYHSKRNHISYFERTFNWEFDELTRDCIDECIAMNEKWYTLNVDKDRESIEDEREVLRLNFAHFEEIGGTGGVLRIDGDVVAFTFGERLNENTFVTHFEKAYSDIRGAYPMINQLFAQALLTDYKYINREDDVGSEGLRSAKLSYHPEFLVEKYSAVRR